MKGVITLFFWLLSIKNCFAQTARPVITYHSFDSIKINDIKNKYSKNIKPIPTGNRVVKNNYYTMFEFITNEKKVLIDSIEFTSLALNFLEDSVISSFSYTIIYGDTNLCKICKYSASFEQKHFEIIKEYLESQLRKKGKYKTHPDFKNMVYYSYIWKQKEDRITLDFQKYHPNGSSIQLTFDNSKKTDWR